MTRLGQQQRGARPENVERHGLTRDEAMAIYDALPMPVRRALADASFEWSPATAFKMTKEHGAEVSAVALGILDARAWRDVMAGVGLGWREAYPPVAMPS